MKITKSDGTSALHIAAIYDHQTVASILITKVCFLIVTIFIKHTWNIPNNKNKKHFYMTYWRSQILNKQIQQSTWKVYKYICYHVCLSKYNFLYLICRQIVRNYTIDVTWHNDPKERRWVKWRLHLQTFRSFNTTVPYKAEFVKMTYEPLPSQSKSQYCFLNASILLKYAVLKLEKS
jgi:hypothetical protein